MRTEAPSTRRDQPPQRLLVTGGTGVLGRALRPLVEAAGHELTIPTREELDLFTTGPCNLSRTAFALALLDLAEGRRHVREIVMNITG